VEVVASLSQGRTVAAQFGLFTHKSVPAIFEPPCITVFGTYHGALTIDLKILFWNLVRISMFDLFAVPQRGMPYVQTGLRIVLYINSLVSSGSFDFLPMIQYILWNCRPSCFLLVNICFCHSVCICV
jgi:hypothetical protein